MSKKPAPDAPAPVENACPCSGTCQQTIADLRSELDKAWRTIAKMDARTQMTSERVDALHKALSGMGWVQ
jgi:hypothetical protein